MYVTFFGAIWLFLVLIAFLRDKANALLFITLLSTIFQCNNVLEIESLGIGSHVITALAFSMRTFHMKSCAERQNSFKRTLVLFSIFILYVFINTLINNADSIAFATIIQLIIYLVCTYRIYQYRSRISDNQRINYVLLVIKFVAFIAPVQLIATFGLIPRAWLSPLFFNEVGRNVYFHHPEAYQRLLSTFLEPSFCAPFLVGALFFIICMKYIRSKYKLMIFLLFIELLLTTSSTGYISFMVTFISYLLLVEYKRIHLGQIVTILFCVVAFYYYTKDTLLADVFFHKLESNSGKYRMMQDGEALLMFSKNTFLGIGYGNSRASSMITTLLAEFGCVGISLYALFLYSLVYPLLSSCKNLAKENAARFFLLSVIISQLIAIPDLQYCVFWFAMYIVALSVPTISRKVLT